MLTKYLLAVIFLILNSCTQKQLSNNLWTLSFHSLKLEQIGRTVEESFYSPILQQEWKYNIYYPADYDTNKKYPIIYLLHGSYGSHVDWKNLGEVQMILDRIIATKKLSPSIVIMPDAQETRYTDIPGTNMRTAFEKDLFPYVETNFPVLNKKEARAIGGLSMGGYGSIVFALRNPKYFGAAFALSPSVTREGKAPPDVLKKGLEKNFDYVYGNPFEQEKWDELGYNPPYKSYLAQDSTIRFFVATGTDDIITPVEDSRDFVANLKRDNIEHLYIEVPNAGHSWGFWSQMLYSALEYTGQELSIPK